MYQLISSCAFLTDPCKFLEISCLHEPSGDLAKNRTSESRNLEWCLRFCISSIPGNTDGLHFDLQRNNHMDQIWKGYKLPKNDNFVSILPLNRIILPGSSDIKSLPAVQKTQV